ncbi:hypothetical protein IG193_08320 [Infirmifilum lucidum]|uniref:Uncharacterized protein n=1 Tax=Infirmifilum lucidum TaxID=2776706 RepID=A0A7L9FG14_9CREN|nr:hypothetical protein [Infirmifilum lucidum]QOJ78740.1 hypothetical protein IG193_08320 [Infirmifilum lucidum]
MKQKLITLGIVLAVLLAFSILKATTQPAVVVAVDLGHGESDKYLNYIMGNITFVNWKVIKGPINESVLKDVDILLLGQPTVALSPDEMTAIKNWLNSGNKVLYIGGDSDYGPGGKTITQINDLLAAIGTKLRLEHGAVYSDNPDVTAKAFYRMLVFVEPDPDTLLRTDMVKENIKLPILMHGPGCVIWVDEQGKYHDPVKETYPGLIRLVWAHKSYIGDNTPPTPYLYDLMTYGKGTGDHDFVMYAAEYWPDKNVLIVLAGESIYGDYEPAWSSQYYGKSLDGPTFVTNLVKWWVYVVREVPSQRAAQQQQQLILLTVGAVVVVAAVVVALFLVRKRRPQAKAEQAKS